ncbi:MAG: hypothetical protein ABI758_01365 [Candidatus Woesebacteria bacterium]
MKKEQALGSGFSSPNSHDNAYLPVDLKSAPIFTHITPENPLIDPSLAYEYATDVVALKPDLLPQAVTWRWETELARGIVNFDPREPTSYQRVPMDEYVKRIIPDRIQPKTEKFSNPDVPVYLPFEIKYPNNFDFTMATTGQKLLSIKIESHHFDLYASNSPLFEGPHSLLVPREPRSQFLLSADMEAISLLREKYPEFHFVYSSMGGGAGVNHQHWHVMAGLPDYPVLQRPISVLHSTNKVTIGHYPDFPNDCLVIENTADNSMKIETQFIQYLQQNNIPHNLFVWKNRSWITPRSHTESLVIPDKKYGAWETILGVCNACSQSQYDFINVGLLELALQEIQLERFKKEEIVQKFIQIVKSLEK